MPFLGVWSFSVQPQLCLWISARGWGCRIRFIRFKGFSRHLSRGWADMKLHPFLVCINHPFCGVEGAYRTEHIWAKKRRNALNAAKRYLPLPRSVSIVEPGLMVGMKQQQLQFRTLILHQRQLQKIQRRTPKVRLAKVLLQQLSVLFLFPQVHISIFSIQKR